MLEGLLAARVAGLLANDEEAAALATALQTLIVSMQLRRERASEPVAGKNLRTFIWPAPSFGRRIEMKFSVTLVALSVVFAVVVVSALPGGPVGSASADGPRQCNLKPVGNYTDCVVHNVIWNVGCDYDPSQC